MELKIPEKFVTINDAKIRYLQEGTSKKTMVLIHGLGASAERWEQVLPHFKKKYTVIVPDLIGFGKSDKPNVDYTIEFFAQFIDLFLKKLGVKEAVIVGSSLGGQVAIEYCWQHQKNVNKLVLVSPSGATRQSTPALNAYVSAALYPDYETAKNAFEIMTGNNKPVSEKTIHDFVQRMQMPNAKFAFLSTLLGLKNAPELAPKLEILRVPTLIVWGNLDPVIPVKYAEYFVKKIRDCRFYQIEGCGHTPYVEEPENFVKIVMDFVDK